VIVALDLDDTLYPEETYVRSGFRAVARALAARWPVEEQHAFSIMWESLEREGRGAQFDRVVEELGLTGRQSVTRLVRVYRHHQPDIELPEDSRAAIEALQPRPLYIVTDGHKTVQQRKIDALGLSPYLRHAYVTHRYGIHHRKPSPRVFELMMRRERVGPQEIAYVGDDASKDFRGIRPLGIRTIRVLTGRHAPLVVTAAEDAERKVAGMAEVPAVVAEMEREAV
jgi:putative hydrolase of the HAD superfamily